MRLDIIRWKIGGVDDEDAKLAIGGDVGYDRRWVSSLVESAGLSFERWEGRPIPLAALLGV